MNSVLPSQNNDSSKNTENIKIKNMNSYSLNNVYKMKLQNKLTETKNIDSLSPNKQEDKNLNEKTLGILHKLVKKELAKEIKERIIQVLSKKEIKAQLKVFLNLFLKFL